MESCNQSSDQGDSELISRAIREARVHEQAAACYSLKDDLKIVEEKLMSAFSTIRSNVVNRLGRPFRF